MQDRITRSRLAGEPADIMLWPRLGHIGLLEFSSAAEAIIEGLSERKSGKDDSDDTTEAVEATPAKKATRKRAVAVVASKEEE